MSAPVADVREVDTPHGPARVHLSATAADAVGALVLGHGAGGGVAAPDLVRVRDVALDLGFGVALVEQPYRVAGRKSPAPARQLDAAWEAVIDALRDDEVFEGRMVVGGRSSGARVACRTAGDVGAGGVLCLAFPWIPPGKGPEKSREDELHMPDVPVLIVQGDRDPFGMPAPAQGQDLVVVAGDHGLKKDLGAVGEAVRGWLPRVAGAGQRTPTRSTTKTSVSSGPITPPAPRLP